MKRSFGATIGVLAGTFLFVPVVGVLAGTFLTATAVITGQPSHHDFTYKKTFVIGNSFEKSNENL